MNGRPKRLGSSSGRRPVMRILVISDLHGEMNAAAQAAERLRPDLLLSCGDWGDPDQVSEGDLRRFLEICTALSTFGNHDPLDLLGRIRNRDGSKLMLGQGEVRELKGLKIGAIGGIWAKSQRLPHYVTDADVAGFAEKIAAQGTLDILLTHGCPIGLADLTPSGRRGGQRCFLEAFQRIGPRLHLCGHLHVPQEKSLKDGRKVVNVGATPDGCIVMVVFDEKTRALQSSPQCMRKHADLAWPS
jgi:Icc-related predicted phosphoesterase